MKWIKYYSNIYFLTDDDIAPSPDGITYDMIEEHFGIKGGERYECNDFSDQYNFPEPLRDAIKAGKLSKNYINDEILNNKANYKFAVECEKLWEEFKLQEKPIYQRYIKNEIDWDDYKRMSQKYSIIFYEKMSSLFHTLITKKENRNKNWQ